MFKVASLHSTLLASTTVLALAALVCAPAPAGTLLPAAATQPAGNTVPGDLTAENIILVYMGGIRETECLDAPDFGECPHLGNDLMPLGVWYPNFYNMGRTGEQAGRCTVSCGTRIGMRGGPNSPDYPTLIEQWRALTGAPKDEAWVIGSDQQYSADDSHHPLYAGRDLGPHLETGYTDEEATTRMLQVIQEYQPRIAILTLEGPDEAAQYSAHPWEDYLHNIGVADRLAWEVEKTVREMPDYGQKTAIFYIDYHGRHDDDHGGFEWHGDFCKGCRDITFVATGPDFPAGAIRTQQAEQIDLHATLAAMLNVPVPRSNGRILEEMFLPGLAPRPATGTARRPEQQAPAKPGVQASAPLYTSAGNSRFPDVHRVGPDYFAAWSEARSGFDGNAWDILLSHSTDAGASWSAPQTVLAANDTLRPWQCTLAGDVDEGLRIGISAAVWEKQVNNFTWTWHIFSFKMPPGSDQIEPLPVASTAYGYVEDRPAVLARDGITLEVHSDSFFRRHSVAWLPDRNHALTWFQAYNWNSFGYPMGLAITADAEGPIALETLRMAETGRLHATRLDGEVWGDLGTIFWNDNQAAIQATVGATGNHVLAAWVDDTQGENQWELRAAYSDNAPKVWSAPITVAPGTGPAWRPDLWVQNAIAAVTWEDYSDGSPQVLLSVSIDGGITWDAPRSVAATNPRLPRVTATPSQAVVVWEEMSGPATDIFVSQIPLQ